MPTKDELADELARVTAERDELRARVDAGPDATTAAPAYKPFRPFLSEGERQDLAMNGVTNSAFTGEQLTASGEGVEPKTATARRNDERAADARRPRADVVGLDVIPVDGVTPAAVDDTDE